MFISYAQNCEDIVLWRVLGHVSNGTYVDVGAADPTEYSVTKAFYDRGWSGINVEPAPEFVRQLEADRPRDTTVALCAGEDEGTMLLHHVVGTGLSTLSDDYLDSLADKQFEVVDLEVEVKRLDAILESCGLAGKEIHFLKVDVEGAEETVLRSIDFSVWRPWVVVVEATEPLSTEQTHQAWDALLTDHGYQFCLFDGLNRFYAAAEHAELVHSLSYPAGVFDQPYTVGTGQNELAARAETLIAERDELAQSYERLQAAHDQTVAGYEQLSGKYDASLASYDELHAKYDEAMAAYQMLEAQLQETVQAYERLEAEHSSTIAAFTSLEHEHLETIAGYARLHDEYDHTLAAYTRVEAMYYSHDQALSMSQQEVASVAAALADRTKQFDELTSQLEAAQLRIAAIERSTSWKVTRPLRMGARFRQELIMPYGGYVPAVTSVPMSRLCTQQGLESANLQRWAETLREPHLWMHRKLWEWCYITDTLYTDGMLAPGKRGLGFAVGHEPLVAHFASTGASILASDLDVDRAADKGWVESNEHAASLAKLNDRRLCDAAQFDQLVDFRPLDMTNFDPAELGEFDFVWSSCAFEHLGSLDAGHHYVVEAMKCLRVGGLAVHTTEFNAGSNDKTVTEGGTVIYRQRDIEALVVDLLAEGHHVEVDFDRGTQPADYHVDIPPYTHETHLKLHLLGHTTTSVGLAIRHG